MYEHFPFMSEIYRGQGNAFRPDITPNIEFRPITDREYTNILALVDASVIDIPQLRTLQFWIPFSKVVADRKDAFLGTGLFLIAPGAADAGIEFELGDGIQERVCLQPVAAGEFTARLGKPTLTDGILHFSHDEFCTNLPGQCVPVVKGFLEIVTGVDMYQWERKASGSKGLLCQPHQSDRILAPTEQERRTLELGGHFPQDVNTFRLKLTEMVHTPVDDTAHVDFYRCLIR